MAAGSTSSHRIYRPIRALMSRGTNQRPTRLGPPNAVVTALAVALSTLVVYWAARIMLHALADELVGRTLAEAKQDRPLDWPQPAPFWLDQRSAVTPLEAEGSPSLPSRSR